MIAMKTILSMEKNVHRPVESVRAKKDIMGTNVCSVSKMNMLSTIIIPISKMFWPQLR